MNMTISTATDPGSDPVPAGPGAAYPSIEIFRVGTHVAVDGREVSFSAADLQDVIDSYDPVAHPAPIVVGHPRLDDPAYGWVGGMTMAGDVLVADPDNIDASFAELVRAKRFRKVSASFYHPDQRANPVPGRWYLRHVGFLGAAAPAVKGLRPVSFGEGDQGDCITVEIAFSEQQQEHEMADKKPVVTAEKIGGDGVKEGTHDARAVEFAEREAALNDREASVTAREQAVAERAKADRHAAGVSFAEQLVGAGKVPPFVKDKIIGILDALDDQAAVSFGEGDGKVELTPAAAFRSLFDQAQPVIAFGEHAPADKTTLGASDPVDAARQINRLVDEARARGEALSFAEAAGLVRDGKAG